MEISSSTHLIDEQTHHDDCLLLADEQKMIDIAEPHHHDVLCGRGVTTNRHPGNESFRSLVGLNKVSQIFESFVIPDSLPLP